MFAFAAWAAAASLDQAAPGAPVPPAQPAPPASAPRSAPQPEPEPQANSASEPEVGGVTVTAPKAEPQWSRKLNLDPGGDFAAGAVPYYDRPLRNGCRLALTVRCRKTFW